MDAFCRTGAIAHWGCDWNGTRQTHTCHQLHRSIPQCGDYGLGAPLRWDTALPSDWPGESGRSGLEATIILQWGPKKIWPKIQSRCHNLPQFLIFQLPHPSSVFNMGWDACSHETKSTQWQPPKCKIISKLKTFPSCQNQIWGGKRSSLPCPHVSQAIFTVWMVSWVLSPVFQILAARNAMSNFNLYK